MSETWGARTPLVIWQEKMHAGKEEEKKEEKKKEKTIKHF